MQNTGAGLPGDGLMGFHFMMFVLRGAESSPKDYAGLRCTRTSWSPRRRCASLALESGFPALLCPQRVPSWGPVSQTETSVGTALNGHHWAQAPRSRLPLRSGKLALKCMKRPVPLGKRSQLRRRHRLYDVMLSSLFLSLGSLL